jgi:hypothetical protein
MRISILSIAAAVALAALPPTAQAGNKGCPPGLAKKAVPCVPPGQAKKYRSESNQVIRYGSESGQVIHRYDVGDRIDDYIVIRDPYRYNLDPRQTYYRSGDYVYQVDRQTRQVLALIGLVDALLN